MSSTYARTSALRAVPASPIAETRHRPLPIPSARRVGGPLAAWQQRDGEATIPHCIERARTASTAPTPPPSFRELLAEACNDGTRN